MEGSDQIMPDTSIQAFQPNDGALSAEHYQTFELAKEHDGILGSSDIAQIRTYAAYARAQAQTIHKTIAKTNGIEDVAAIKSEATETAQTFAKVSIYADQRIGEILRELPKGHGNRFSTTVENQQTKAQALKDSGISTPTAYQLEQLAANPDVVQAVLDKAEADGRIPSRNQVLKAIQERDGARFIADKLKKQRDEAREDADGYAEEIRDMQEEIAALEKQADKAYEDGYKAATHNAQPQVVTREVAPEDYEELKRRAKTLEGSNRLYHEDYQKLRKKNEELRRELDKAKDMLGMDKTLQDVRSDVQYLISATNQYVRRYGGLTWTAASLEQVDEDTRAELKKAATNLATFATALVASLESINE